MTPPDPDTLQAEISRLKRRLERERSTRLEAEAIAEKGLRDLYERQRELQTLERIATKANQAETVRDVLQFSLEEICHFHDWKAGHAYLTHMTEAGLALRPAGVWFAGDAETLCDFREITETSEWEPGIGLPGRALQSGKPIWIDNIANDTNFPRLAHGKACGLRSAISFPVLTGDKVMAVLEFFDTAAREPNSSMLDMMLQVGTQIGRVIERHHAEERMRLQTEELVKARDQAEAADRAKSAFLANMSHELRTPLNAIIGFSEIMQHEIAGSLNDKYKEYAGDIQRSGVHLKNIINDILDLSKIAVDALELREAPVSICALIEGCISIVAPMAEAGGIQVDFTAPSGLPLCEADETRLKQAVLNVISNAVKFTPPGGTVSVSAQSDTQGLSVSVIDSGIGMSAQDVAVALQPFRQIDSALSRRYEGTGLGLPLAKAFIELHDGSLTIDSVPSLGTTVVIHLPAARMKRAA